MDHKREEFKRCETKHDRDNRLAADALHKVEHALVLSKPKVSVVTALAGPLYSLQSGECKLAARGPRGLGLSLDPMGGWPTFDFCCLRYHD